MAGGPGGGVGGVRSPHGEAPPETTRPLVLFDPTWGSWESLSVVQAPELGVGGDVKASHKGFPPPTSSFPMGFGHRQAAGETLLTAAEERIENNKKDKVNPPPPETTELGECLPHAAKCEEVFSDLLGGLCSKQT